MKKCGYYFLIVANFCIYGLLNNAQSSEVLLSDTEAELQLAEQGTVAPNLPKTDISNLTRHELVLGRWYEGGVVNRLQTDYFGNYQINEILSIELGVGVSTLEQWGPSLLGISGKVTFPNARSQLILGIQYERWPTWRMAENRVELYWKFFPQKTFNISFGFAYRAVQHNVISFLPYLNWNSDPNGELDILYGIDWILFKISPLQISWLIWDFDHMRLFNMDNVHFTIKTNWTFDSTLQAYLAATTGVTGVSGGILTWSQSIISLGLVYGL